MLTEPAEVTPPRGLVTCTLSGFASDASLPEQPLAAAAICPGLLDAVSFTCSVQLRLVSVAVNAPLEVAVPPVVKPVEKDAPVPADSDNEASVVPWTSSVPTAASPGVAVTPVATAAEMAIPMQTFVLISSSPVIRPIEMLGGDMPVSADRRDD